MTALVEPIEHKTDERPFSMHQTLVGPKEPMALYLHCHEEAEIFYLDYGELDFEIENRTYKMKAGDSIFIPPNLIHCAHQSGTLRGCGYQALVFSLEKFESNLPPYCHKYFVAVHEHRKECVYLMTPTTPGYVDIRSMLRELFKMRDCEVEKYEMRLYGTICVCWQEMYEKCFSRVKLTRNIPKIHTELQKSIDYLHEHYADTISLEQMASVAGLSSSYFCRSFHEYTGQKPMDFLNRIRIIKSCELLSGTDSKIAEIAGKCGFNNISYFNRIFKGIMEMEPTKYRRITAASDKKKR